MKKTGLGILMLCMIFCLASCTREPAETTTVTTTTTTATQTTTAATPEPTPAPDADDLVKEVITAYGEENEALARERLALLKSADASRGETWEKILDYWCFAREEMVIHENSLPKVLRQDDGLCIVVLGYKLKEDGSMKKELLGRLETALSCARQYPDAYVLCTGGGTAEENDAVTEAGQMGKWLLENGLEPERLILEDQSLSTVQNAQFSCGILREQYPMVREVAVVSSAYHIRWSSLYFEAQFLLTQGDGQELHVVSNGAYPLEKEKYDDTLEREKSGLLALAKAAQEP